MRHRISKANDAAQEEIGGAEPGSYYSGPARLAGMMQIRLGTILFCAFLRGCPSETAPTRCRAILSGAGGKECGACSFGERA